MAVREFAQGEYVTWSVGTGGLATVLQGAFTVAAIAKRIGAPAQQGALLDLANGLAGSRGFFRYTDTDLMNYLRGQFQSPGDGPGWDAADDWCMVAFTKAAGTASVRYHLFPFGVSWTHVDSSGTVDNDDATCDRAQTRFAEDADWVFRGRYAVMGVWDSVLADLTLEGLTSSYSDWQATSPITLWRFDQAATSDPIDDQTTGGADQTALVGSTVVTGDDPPGFTFEAGGPVALDGPADSAGSAEAVASVARRVSGAAPAAGAAAGTPTILRGLAGSAPAASQPQAVLQAARPLAGSAVAAASATGRLAEQVAAGTATQLAPDLPSSLQAPARVPTASSATPRVPTAGGVA